MFRMLTRTTIIVTILTSTLAWAQQAPPSIQQLRDGFLNPPPQARLRCYWWWLNGNTDKATITHDLEAMKAKGFGGALLVDAGGANQEGNAPVPAGPTFASTAWVALYQHALQEADRLGLEITLNITSGWNLGGPSVTPEQASKILTWSRSDIRNGEPAPAVLAAPASKNGFYREIAVLAYPLAHGAAMAAQPGTSSDSPQRTAVPMLAARAGAAETGFSMPDTSAMLLPTVAGDPTGSVTYADANPSQLLDITAHVASNGTLSWKAPAGDWEILRIGYTDSGARVSTGSGAWQGLAIDYLSRASFEAYWDQVVEPLLKASSSFHSLKYLATDSWELGGTNWTQNFREEFQKRRGYDPVPWLPVVAGRILGDRDRSTRFLTDLRRTIADLVIADHYDVFAEKARQHGLGVQAESGGPHGAPIDALQTFRNAAVPQTEFWSQNPHRNTDKDRFFTKEAASAAHIYGQPIIAQEGETSIGPQWSESLATDLKPSFDMGVTEGMNRLVWHEFTSSPESTGVPGQEYFAGTHLDPKVTWFNAGSAFFTYLNRLQFLMQQGRPVNDLLYYYGDNVPNFVRLKADDPAHVLPGYDYDVTNEDALLHNIQMQDGKLKGPGGMEWKALALPITRRLSLSVLERIETYVRAGGVVIGLPPTSPTGLVTPQTQASFDLLVKKLWGPNCADSASHPYGAGRVYCTQNAHAALQAMNLPPDVSLPPGDAATLAAASTSGLDYLHQHVTGTDLYVLRNGSEEPSRHDITFRAADQHAELWDPVTGEMLALPTPRVLQDGRVQLPIELPPFGAGIVVFTRNTPQQLAPAGAATTSIPMKAVRPWQLTFQPARGGPKKPVSMAELKDWSTFEDPAVRYYSGTATYRTNVLAPDAASGKRVWMHFHDIHEIARVSVNGVDAGTVWAKPFNLRVDRYLRPGENQIEIEVTNLWPNRIIGDLQPGITKRLTSTNITKYKPDSPLLASGLIGPIDWLVEH